MSHLLISQFSSKKYKQKVGSFGKNNYFGLQPSLAVQTPNVDGVQLQVNIHSRDQIDIVFYGVSFLTQLYQVQ